MNLLQVIILGVVEGLTEFLPISSTGHLIVVMSWLGIDHHQTPWPAFLYFVQIGAIAAVVLYCFPALWKQIRYRPDRRWQNHLLIKLAIGCLPAGVVGLALDDLAERYLENSTVVACALIVGAVVMLVIDRQCRTPTGPTIESLSWRTYLAVGLFQCVAIIPGTSRSMVTILGGMVLGLPPSTATELSFYLAIPTLCGAGILRVVKHRHELMNQDHLLLLIGFFTAFVVALATVAGLINYVKTRSLQPFVYYRIGLGALILLLMFSN